VRARRRPGRACVAELRRICEPGAGTKWVDDAAREVDELIASVRSSEAALSNPYERRREVGALAAGLPRDEGPGEVHARPVRTSCSSASTPARTRSPPRKVADKAKAVLDRNVKLVEELYATWKKEIAER